MLPHVDGQQRCLALDERHFGVACFRHLELAARGNQPAPTRAELRHARVGELLFEISVAAEIRVELLRDDAGRLAAAALQAIPEEGVVPRLRRVVEHLHLVGLARGFRDDAL